VGKPQGKTPLDGLGYDGRIILKWILKQPVGEWGVVWIGLVLVNTVTKFRGSISWENYVFS
jgi:hypothetical protein